MTRPMQPTRNPAIAGLSQRGGAQRVEPGAEAVEVADVEEADEAAGEPDQRVPGELCGVAEGERGLGPEDGGEPLDGTEDRVGDDRGDERRDERVRLDIVAVEELGPEDGAAERRAEDRPDTGGHAHRDRDPRIACVEVERPAEEGPEPRADLGGRPLAAARSARSDRDRRGDQLHQRDAAPDAARVVVEGGDRRVGAVALGLRGEAVDDDPRDQAAQGDHEGERPGPGKARDRGAAFAGGRRGRVAAQEAEEEVGRQLEGRVEGDRPDSADDADERTEDDPLAEVVRSAQAAPDRTKAGVELSGERRHANRSSPAAIARSPLLMSSRSESGQPRGDLAQGCAPMGKDRLADRPSAVGQPGSRGAPVQLVDGQGRQPAPFESAKQAARRRQRDADPRRDLADPRPIRRPRPARARHATAETSARSPCPPAPRRGS